MLKDTLTLREARVLFSALMAKLPGKAEILGLELAYDQVMRPPELAKLYEQQGKGVKRSAHLNGLAVDVLLYTKAGDYLTDTPSYLPLGEFWKSLHPLCRWGGDFKKQDGNHFSLEFGGLK